MKNLIASFENPYKIAVRTGILPEAPSGKMLVKTRWSAISSGTELRVYRGEIPLGRPIDISISSLSGQFGYPMKYGYSAVGQVIATGDGVDPDWIDAMVFSFNPHESYFLASENEVMLLPDGVDPLQALFIPNMETAVGLVMDARPIIGETSVIFGQGVPGLLTTMLMARLEPGLLVVVDPLAIRREKALSLGANAALDPFSEGFEELLRETLSRCTPDAGADLVLEMSSNPDGLNQAIRAAGYSGRIVVGSWYGTRRVSLDLSTEFHRNRTRIISSQVSTIDSDHSARWSKHRRMNTVWKMIRRIRPEEWVTHKFDIHEIERAFELLDKQTEPTLQVIIDYE